MKENPEIQNELVGLEYLTDPSYKAIMMEKYSE